MADPPIPPGAPRKGRGTTANPAGRFEPTAQEPFDDGWSTAAEEAPPPRTSLAREAARSALNYNDSPDLGFDRSLNPYRGCEHGCIFCYARPTHAYLGLSPGLDFETKLFLKPDAPALLERELRKPGYVPSTLALGANTDPYQPVERQQKLTRRILEVLSAFNHPVGLITKSALVCRDIDILASMADRRLALVCVSVTTLDPVLARKMEPRAATPARRLAAVRALSQAGVPVAVLASPMIPGLNDHELEAILAAAKEHGAFAANYILLRLPLEIKELFEEWLRTQVPDRADRVLSLIRQTRGGALYDSRFGKRMRGEGPYADLLAHRFRAACRKLDLGGRDWHADASRFRVPPAPGDQLSLF